MSLLSFVVIGAFALLSLRLFMTSRRDRKRAQLRELQQALRRNLDGDKEKRQPTANRREAPSADERRIAELERVVKRAEEESKKLALALEQLQRAHEKPIASKARKSQRKIEPVVAPQASLLPAVMRSGRTGEPITRSLH
ncbi:MAG: hypothetical protein WCY71_11940 [Halothiobacillaceae bacterium]